MVGVCMLVFAGLKMPPMTAAEKVKKAEIAGQTRNGGKEAKGVKNGKIESTDTIETAEYDDFEAERGKRKKVNGVATKPDLRRKKA